MKQKLEVGKCYRNESGESYIRVVNRTEDGRPVMEFISLLFGEPIEHKIAKIGNYDNLYPIEIQKKEFNDKVIEYGKKLIAKKEMSNAKLNG
jgi:hypothetical protein